MNDINLIKNQIAGLIEKGKALRKDEAIFLKMQGINEEIEKTNQERLDNKDKLVKAKENLKKLTAKKNAAVSESTGQIIEKMNKILPSGSAIFDCTDGLFIGWDADEATGNYTPYNGLSGSQKQIFDTALADILDANIIILEAAELDSDHMAAALEDLAGLDKQVIISTCHPVDSIPEPFVKIEL